MAVAAALDLGGGATADRIKEAVRILLSSGRVHTLMICIFGGITRCDEVVEGVRLALAEQAEKKTVVIRMEVHQQRAGHGDCEASVRSGDDRPEHPGRRRDIGTKTRGLSGGG